MTRDEAMQIVTYFAVAAVMLFAAWVAAPWIDSLGQPLPEVKPAPQDVKPKKVLA